MSRRNPTPEEKIITLRAKGAITPTEAKRRLRQLQRAEVVEAAKANRGFLKRVLDFMTP